MHVVNPSDDRNRYVAFLGPPFGPKSIYHKLKPHFPCRKNEVILSFLLHFNTSCFSMKKSIIRMPLNTIFQGYLNFLD